MKAKAARPKLTPKRHLDAINAYWAARERAAAKTLKAVKNNKVSKFRLLAEGDSWFDYPPHGDVIDNLRKLGYNIENVASAGASLFEMAYGPDDDSKFDFLDRDPSQLEECVKLLEDHKPHGFLLSGGGNDIAGPEFILLINHLLANPSGLNRKVLAGVIEDSLRPAYDHIIEVVTAKAVQIGLGALPIFVHGYDYPWPDGRGVLGYFPWNIGPWFDEGFMRKGFARKTKAELERRRGITTLLMDGFNSMLQKVSQDYKNVHYINVRGTLKMQADWSNELHPTRSGFETVAGKFHNVIWKVLNA